MACNQSNEIVAIKTDTWTLARRFPAGTGVYNLAMTKDGRLIATNKRGQSVSIFDPVTGQRTGENSDAEKGCARGRGFAGRPLRFYFGRRSWLRTGHGRSD